MRFLSALFFTVSFASIQAGYPDNGFLFTYDSTGYEASISFTTDLPPDTALQRLYGFEHFLKYKTGLGKVEMIHRSDTSYTILTSMELPFYKMHMSLRRNLNIAENTMIFQLIAFNQSPRLLPEVLEIRGVYRVDPSGNGSKVRLFQTAKNGKERSLIHKMVLESSIRHYFMSIQRYLPESR